MPQPKPVRREGDPFDRLTRLCEAMTDALDAHPERGDEKCMVFLQDGRKGGLQTYGYDEDSEAIADLLFHLKAMFEASGQTLAIVPVGQG
jgi:hypothetical protein